MATVEFWAKVNLPDRTVQVPEEVMDRILGTASIRVVVIVPENGDDLVWSRLAANQFADGYDPTDTIYDDIPAG